MKVMFVGPTLHGLAAAGRPIPGTEIRCRAPAQGGDIARAVLDGAEAIGLVDGRYEDVAAPWHKEILFAISRGVRIYGAASMGALRAAECAAFGMVPVGTVAHRYLCGDLTDDAAVAQIHAPPEMGCLPLSEALVNVEATIAAAATEGAVSPAESGRLLTSARALFFKDRTFATVVDGAGLAADRAATVLAGLARLRRDVKREDALLLVATMRADDEGCVGDANWRFREPRAWRRFIAGVAATRGPEPQAHAM